MKTFIPTEKDIARKTYMIDADGKTLGRMSTKIASLLIGKGKTCFMPDKLTYSGTGQTLKTCHQKRFRKQTYISRDRCCIPGVL